MPRVHARVCLGAILAAAVAAVGCGESTNMVSVHGRVTYGDEAIPKGSVTFYPTAGRPINTPLSADGSYKTALTPGEYVVCISAAAPPPPGYKEGDPLPPPKIVLPPEYSTRATSKLTASVGGEGQTPIDFNLE
jgi:hypothetical protein